MNRKSKSFLSLTGVAFAAVLSFSYASPEQGRLFCQCEENIAFDHNLPLSHPVNRCASTQSDAVSWGAWISGKSSSYQFHFINLLELLSRTKDYTQNASSNATQSK
ncbi:hypothetical protein L0668_05860 [Paraglaciecola aquimarina]|uniref:Secreted protein n=1 Tax=Paraglaciecola algarum TaxID=3050085 RepID=A0ABS9D3W0_9ALTE|nr:hypothetical protein [Paraglaciecola sp. G1-23]MCF2947626.1 hypothetical protein [Paraglaciecola sp. G1-23]